MASETTSLNVIFQFWYFEFQFVKLLLSLSKESSCHLEVVSDCICGHPFIVCCSWKERSSEMLLRLQRPRVGTPDRRPSKNGWQLKRKFHDSRFFLIGDKYRFHLGAQNPHFAKKTKVMIFIISGIKVSKHFIWIAKTSLTQQTESKPDFKDIRAHCYCASLLCRANSHTTSCIERTR